MHSIPWSRVAGAALLTCSWAAQADTVTPGEVTSWGHQVSAEGSSVRGLAYDGQHYYVADCNDYVIDGRPRDNTGRIYIYDQQGKLVKRIPEEPPVRGTFFPTGVATDGVRLWTSGYFRQEIYEYDVASGALNRKFASPVRNVVRLDFQASTQTLWLTGYGDPTVYQVKLDGRVRSRIPISGYGPNVAPAVDGRGDLWVAGNAIDGSNRLVRYDSRGAELQHYPGPTPFTGLATNINSRGAGYVIDLQQAYDPGTGRWLVHLQQFSVQTVGGRTSDLGAVTVQCDNQRSGQSVAAHFGSATHWNCLDGGLAVQSGDPVRVQITGTAP
ncbi:MAG TPA: hypothetical protein VFY73_26500 [Ideonella sp.]|uniref:hypothetical protein n=1 Tax=Ideonella sp. TaxID=1929293 RepID=UPI002E32968B|nr:hypothetical protein [Ideonella sp.]HEX5687580.1 hypothetical protein [Ideonella sp.]